MDRYRTTNMALWNERAMPHAASPDYGVDRLVEDPAFLSDTVRFDLPLLGDVAGLDVVHLQCHIGTDTVSLAKLGARMTGLDLSSASIEQARDLARRAGVAVRFVESDVDDAPAALGDTYDLVYTGIGALCWLPDIRRWAGVIAALLRPGGRLHIREAHPVLWALADPRPDGLLTLEYTYFELPEPIMFEDEGTYVTTDAQFTANRSYEWNHGLGEIITALLDEGFTLTRLVEHDTVPWDAQVGQMEQLAGGEYRLRDRPERLPHTYTLQAVYRQAPGD